MTFNLIWHGIFPKQTLKPSVITSFRNNTIISPLELVHSVPYYGPNLAQSWAHLSIGGFLIYVCSCCCQAAPTPSPPKPDSRGALERREQSIICLKLSDTTHRLLLDWGGWNYEPEVILDKYIHMANIYTYSLMPSQNLFSHHIIFILCTTHRKKMFYSSP